MRAIHLVQRDDPATGGAGRVAVELVKRLPEFGVDAKCLFLYGEPGPFAAELPGQCIHLMLRSARDAWRGSALLRGTLLRERAEVVHHHDGLTWTHLVTPLVPRVRRYGHAHLDPPGPNAPWRHRLAGFLHRRTYGRLVCISEDTRRAWVASGFPTARTVVIPNGVDTDAFTPPTGAQSLAARERLGLPPDAAVIGYCGRLHNAMKGTDDFLRVVAVLPEQVWGVLAGSGPDEDALRALAVELGVAGRVHFAGALSPALPLYHASNAFVLTSHYEPFGLVALEAVACGLPVFAFAARGGLDALLRDVGATVIGPREPRQLAAALLNFLDRECVNGNPPAGNDALARYSWTAAARALAEDYRLERVASE